MERDNKQNIYTLSDASKEKSKSICFIYSLGKVYNKCLGTNFQTRDHDFEKRHTKVFYEDNNMSLSMTYPDTSEEGYFEKLKEADSKYTKREHLANISIFLLSFTYAVFKERKGLRETFKVARRRWNC